MDVTINGTVENVDKGASLDQVLRARGHDVNTVVVERNGEIVPSAAFSGTPLMPGDCLEIVHFVGGG